MGTQCRVTVGVLFDNQICMSFCVLTAGKSSTLRVLAGQALPSSGDARVGGVSVLRKEGHGGVRPVGYCPQVHVCSAYRWCNSGLD